MILVDILLLNFPDPGDRKITDPEQFYFQYWTIADLEAKIDQNLGKINVPTFVLRDFLLSRRV